MIRISAEERRDIEAYAALASVSLSEFVRAAVGQRIAHENQNITEQVAVAVAGVAPEENAAAMASSIVARLGAVNAKRVFELPPETQSTLWDSLVSEARKQDGGKIASRQREPAKV